MTSFAPILNEATKASLAKQPLDDLIRLRAYLQHLLGRESRTRPEVIAYAETFLSMVEEAIEKRKAAIAERGAKDFTWEPNLERAYEDVNNAGVPGEDE